MTNLFADIPIELPQELIQTLLHPAGCVLCRDGDRLIVNLGASQARRRLKGFGHGVRKVQTGGKNQAVIIHTATGRHLVELKMEFADVGYWCRETDLSAR